MFQAAKIRELCRGLSLNQRGHLKIIAGMRDGPMDEGIVQSLIALGLVQRNGETYCATEDGVYIAQILLM